LFSDANSKVNLSPLLRAAGSSDWAGTTYYFCSLEHQLDFDRQPDRYVPSLESEA
jgi:YHS domain-containing protein